MRKIIIGLLFFIAYLPLFAYLLILKLAPTQECIVKDVYLKCVWDEKSFLILCFLGILALTSAFTLMMFWIFSNRSQETKTIISRVEKPSSFIEFMMTYFFAVLSLKLESPQEIIASSFLLLFIAWIYTKSGLIYSNPVWMVFGYRIYETEIDGIDHKVIILSRNKDILGKNIPLVELSKDNSIFIKH